MIANMPPKNEIKEPGIKKQPKQKVDVIPIASANPMIVAIIPPIRVIAAMAVTFLGFFSCFSSRFASSGISWIAVHADS